MSQRESIAAFLASQLDFIIFSYGLALSQRSTNLPAGPAIERIREHGRLF
jgi:hypothetical protein